MLVISSREFRQNQLIYLDKVDDGEQIIVQRGKDKSYKLVPIREKDMFINVEMIDRIKESATQAKDGKFIEISSSEQIKDLLGL